MEYLSTIFFKSIGLDIRKYGENLSKPSYLFDCESVAPEDELVVHGVVGERFVKHLLYHLRRIFFCFSFLYLKLHLGGDFILQVIEADDIGLLQLQQVAHPPPLLLSELHLGVELNGFQWRH